MGRPKEAEDLLRAGHYPFEISKIMGISVKSVIQYLQLRVGKGELRLSDIYFSYPPEKREILRDWAMDSSMVEGFEELLFEDDLSKEEIKLVESMLDHRAFAGDMYEYVTDVELTCHSLVKHILENEFGKEESGWWRKGVPKDVRIRCVSRREDDEEPCQESYSYTNLIDLANIMSKNWSLFKDKLPDRYSNNRKGLERDFTRLNRIRNAVMHPVKEKQWTEDDFVFVRILSHVFLTTSIEVYSLSRTD